VAVVNDQHLDRDARHLVYRLATQNFRAFRA
jgi:hypothetical protein